MIGIGGDVATKRRALRDVTIVGFGQFALKCRVRVRADPGFVSLTQGNRGSGVSYQVPVVIRDEVGKKRQRN